MKIITVLCCVIVSSLVGVDCANCDVNKTGLPDDTCAFDLRMRGAQPKRADQYLCSGYNFADEIMGYEMDPSKDSYIVSFEPLANANKAHHILVYGCSNVQKRSKPWACGSVCGSGGQEQILFAWAKNADALSLPEGVGRLIGPRANINYIVVQVHYVAPLTAPDTSGIRIYFTQQRQQYMAGIYLMLAYSVTIPEHVNKVHADISCEFNWDTSIVPFGFRTHAHSLGKVISGYKERNGVYTLIGKGNPQWPQAFYPVNTTRPISINPGDNLLARCTYDSTDRDRTTHIGASSADEMCNFYMMYYMNASDADKKGHFETCAGNNVDYIFDNVPPGSDTPLPRNEKLEDKAAGGHYHHSNEGEEPDQNEAANQIVDNKPAVVPQSHKPGNRNNLNGNLRNGGNFNKNDKYDSGFDNGVGLSDGLVGSGRVHDIGTFNFPRKAQQYLYDYEPDYQDSDYYSGVRSRARNNGKKPYYDIDELGKGYLSDYSDTPFYAKQKSSLSRNRNKIFDQKYDDYASEYSKGSIKSASMKKNGDHVEESIKGDHSDSPVKTSATPEVVKPNNLDLKFISEFGNIEIGQVGGLAVNDAGELHIFHRGSRVWDALSFDYGNVYQQQRYPVVADAVIILNKDGSIKRHFGKNRYFLPHGLSLDSAGNIWLTDVALHQVFRIPYGKDDPDMTLGMRFEPGNDDEHFCKPSDVAVTASGEFFVSDGYCNSRIMKFDQNGYYVTEWGTPGSRFASGFPPPGTFNLPHSLALAEDKKLVCVADRENGRIQCFDFNGKFVRQMHHEMFGKNVYALEYCPKHGGVLFAVNGPIIGPNDKETRGFTVDINNGNVLSTWNIPAQGLTHPHDLTVDTERHLVYGLTHPHDLTVDTERHLVYVGELNPSKVWKFEMSKYLLQANKTQGTSSTDKPESVSVDQTTGQKISTEQISRATQTTQTVPRTHSSITHTFSSVKPPLDVVISNNSPPHTTFRGVKPTPDVVISNKSLSDNPFSSVKPPLDVVSHDTVVSHNDVVSPDDISHNETVNVVIVEELNNPEYAAEDESFAPSLIIGTLLVVPVVLLILITVIVRLYNTGHFERCRAGRRGTRSKFNLGNLLNSHKGFDRLSTEDDDHDLENALDDSDNEEFSIVRKA